MGTEPKGKLSGEGGLRPGEQREKVRTGHCPARIACWAETKVCSVRLGGRAWIRAEKHGPLLGRAASAVRGWLLRGWVS